MPNWPSGTHVDGGTGAFGGVPYGATTRCTGWVERREEGEEGPETLYWVCGTHADGSAGTF
eukprot:4773363-Pyramimonas_sp.AAC.1